ncbi:ABC transporter ATP-binding protein [Vineibacter terrae]|uniref:ABC transporter ATP-binding protein n=1 Tax=Vineibacter terrae TaxID=2586908 RepID=UPI002E32961D|nr:ABC transporter ATP-binding protein [Vineibacter terrae]HEX2890666.1 ABC transporter ATP-binding protein [Vineibacter terrae]
MTQPLLQVADLRTYLFTRNGVVRAVDGVSFHVDAGETLGIVGESGSGKSMTALSIQRMLPRPAGRIVGGEIRLEGEDLVVKSERQMSAIRGRSMAMILQDPMSSLNPVFTIGQQVSDPLRTHRKLPAGELRKAVERLLDMVRIPAPQTRVNDYPHQMSGGMRQRIVGAIALSCEPKLLVADEPTTALDVTVQAQYLRLLRDLQARLGLAIIMITHDFGVVARICDRVAVMYAGRIVETAATTALFDRPAHPYTQALMRSMPRLDQRSDRLPAIDGQPPDLRQTLTGCRFAPRCAHASDICRQQYPEMTVVSPGHTVNCWHADRMMAAP